MSPSVRLLDLVILVVKDGSGQFVTTFVTSEPEAFGEALCLCELWMEVNWRVEDNLRPRGWRNRQIKDDKANDSCILAELAAHELAPTAGTRQKETRRAKLGGEKKLLTSHHSHNLFFPALCTAVCFWGCQDFFFFGSIFSWPTTAAAECF